MLLTHPLRRFDVTVAATAAVAHTPKRNPARQQANPGNGHGFLIVSAGTGNPARPLSFPIFLLGQHEPHTRRVRPASLTPPTSKPNTPERLGRQTDSSIRLGLNAPIAVVCIAFACHFVFCLESGGYGQSQIREVNLYKQKIPSRKRVKDEKNGPHSGRGRGCRCCGSALHESHLDRTNLHNNSNPNKNEAR